jgi:hypothetical protein
MVWTRQTTEHSQERLFSQLLRFRNVVSHAAARAIAQLHPELDYSLAVPFFDFQTTARLDGYGISAANLSLPPLSIGGHA